MTPDTTAAPPRQCINAPVDGAPGKRWDGRTGQPCDGPIGPRLSLAGTGTVDLCERHAADQGKWRADIDRRNTTDEATTGQPSPRSPR